MLPVADVSKGVRRQGQVLPQLFRFGDALTESCEAWNSPDSPTGHILAGNRMYQIVVCRSEMQLDACVLQRCIDGSNSFRVTLFIAALL